jgi:hypothetical protein
MCFGELLLFDHTGNLSSDDDVDDDDDDDEDDNNINNEQKTELKIQIMVLATTTKYLS